MILASSLAKNGITQGIKVFKENKHPIEVIENVLKVVEADETVYAVGKGGHPNFLGEMELDAGIMNGDYLHSGAVAALKNYLHPISVARSVYENSKHVLLVGEGAARYAEELGFKKDDILASDAKKDYEVWLAGRDKESLKMSDIHVGDDVTWKSPEMEKMKLHHDTAVVICRSKTVSKTGTLCAGTSTSGWSFKYPGRVGDSPIVGAGFYADSRYGACVCTHTGEMTIRALTSKVVVEQLASGKDLKSACLYAIKELKEIKQGVIGDVAMHAMDKNGETAVMYYSKNASKITDPLKYYLWDDGFENYRELEAEVVG